MSSEAFRTADDRDVDALVALVERAYRGEPSREGWCTEADLIDGQRVDADMVRAVLADPDAAVLVLHGDDAPLGCCELRRIDDGRATLGMFAVDPVQQAGGVGRRVLAEAERYVVDRWGVRHLELTVIDVRTSLIEWYERRGYERTGEHRPFPYGDERYGRPRVEGLRFAVLEKHLGPATGMVEGHV